MLQREVNNTFSLLSRPSAQRCIHPPGRKQEEGDLEHSERTRLGYFLPKEHEQLTPTGPSHTSIVSTMNPTEIGTNAENVSE